MKILAGNDLLEKTQKEIHYSLGRIYFATFSKNRTNFARRAFQSL